MNHNFNYVFQQLTGVSVPDKLASNPAEEEVEFMTRLVEDNHIVLLRALLSELQESATDGKTPSCSHLFESVQTDFNNLIIDFHKRLQEFRKLWTDRYRVANMLPTLKKFDWIAKRDEKFYLTGDGSPDEAHNFYKFTVKDTVSEGVRIMALFDGALSRLQEKISTQWHEQLQNNENKLIPLLESSMRTREMNELKTIRRKLPEVFLKHFCGKVKDWSELSFPTEEELYRKIAGYWYKQYHNENGFEGFMLFISEFVWELIKLKTDLYENKWRILLRGQTIAAPALS